MPRAAATHPAIRSVMKEAADDPAEGGFTIQAERRHAAELRALFQQHGITCEVHPEASPGKDELAFTWEVKVSDVREILEACKSPSGS